MLRHLAEQVLRYQIRKKSSWSSTFSTPTMSSDWEISKTSESWAIRGKAWKTQSRQPSSTNWHLKESGGMDSYDNPLKIRYVYPYNSPSLLIIPLTYNSRLDFFKTSIGSCYDKTEKITPKRTTTPPNPKP